MSDVPNPVVQLLREDPRYRFEAYQFVREALAYAQDVMHMGKAVKEEATSSGPEQERHITGQQLCEAIRRYALEQYGYMAQVVLNSWGIRQTSDFGEIVYNLIRIGFMKKSETDRREDFNNVYDFEEAFREQFQIKLPDGG